jgi:hypothetical protein
MTPTKDAHGVTIRNDEYPLMPNDEFTLHSCQVHGTYDGYPHSALPGRYFIEMVSGVNGNMLSLVSMTSGRRFVCSTMSVYAVMGPWSEYQKGETDGDD